MKPGIFLGFIVVLCAAAAGAMYFYAQPKEIAEHKYHPEVQRQTDELTNLMPKLHKIVKGQMLWQYEPDALTYIVIQSELDPSDYEAKARKAAKLMASKLERTGSTIKVIYTDTRPSNPNEVIPAATFELPVKDL